MKNELLPTPKDLTLSEVMERFATDDKAREYLEAVRWPKGPVCPHCKNVDTAKIWKIEANPAKKVRHGLYQCAECNGQFTVTVGTIYEDSHIPLRKWLTAWYLVCSAKKGISALQVQRSLGLGSYRTAWLMMHKIRHAMKDPVFTGKLQGTVEIDETFVGGKPRPDAFGSAPKPKFYRKPTNKVPVVAIIERNGNVRTKVVASVSHKNLKSFVNKNVDKKATVNTDQFGMYRTLLFPFDRHDTVNHSQKEYARHNADGTVSHVNNCESFFSLIKRGIVGAFHHVSPEHLPRYCAEFEFRWNTRKSTDGERMFAGLQKAEGKRLMYRTPIGKK